MVEHERRGWIDAVTWRFSRIAMVLPAIIVVIMIYEIFMRYVVNSATIWVTESSLWMGGWVYLLAGIYAMQQRSHIRIFILYDMVPKPVQRLFDILSTLMIAAWCYAIIFGYFNAARRAFVNWEAFDSAWRPPIPAINKPAIMIIMVIITIQAISNLIMDWNKESGEQSAKDDFNAEIEEVKRAQGMIDTK